LPNYSKGSSPYGKIKMQSDTHSIRLGEIFKFGEVKDLKFRDYYELAKGPYETGVDSGKGIFQYAKVKRDGRVPAIILHSNPFAEGSKKTPWIDDINPAAGYAIYSGDNKSSEITPFESRGNKMLVKALELYKDPGARLLAPPVLIFKQELVNGKTKGYRSFQGYGILLQAFTRAQKEVEGSEYYSNLVFEVLLLNMSNENESFDWRWIDDRRNSALTAEDALRYAPLAWKQWATGKLSIDSPHIRHNAARSKIIPIQKQREYSKKERDTLEAIYAYYGGNKSNDGRHLFENLAAVIAGKILGTNYYSGWITKRAGDGGIDFVGRLDVGIESAKTSAVVLGQAKCIDPINGGISGLQLARVAARLKRGWLGIFVTTGSFNNAAQAELFADKYPIILVNGQVLAREVLKIMNIEGTTLKEFLDDITSKYEVRSEPIDAERILEWEFPPIANK